MNRGNLIVLLCCIAFVVLAAEGNIVVRADSRAVRLVLPVVSGVALLLSLGLFACDTGWDQLAWAFAALLAGVAFAGALLGWRDGSSMRA